VHDIDEDDFNIEKGGQVEIIGWLYQYYIAEPKDKLINAHKKYTTKDIPYVTQLFTSEWIVKYMVENSLGRMWNNKHRSNVKSNRQYYIDSSDNQLVDENVGSSNPEEITIIDPCMGSGHILVYTFDVLMQIYEECGWNQKDAAKSILEKNLYGLDIDGRAAQLAYFSLMMKARQYNRRILQQDVKCNLFEIEEVNQFDEKSLQILDDASMSVAQRIFDEFNCDVKAIGSLLKPNISIKELNELIEFIDKYEPKTDDLLDVLYSKEVKSKLRDYAVICKLLVGQYDIVATNPPYLNSSLMPEIVKKLATDEYKEFKNDLFSMFIKRCSDFSVKEGYIALLTPYVWMFINSYEDMRAWVISNLQIVCLTQLEYNAFEAACVPVATYVLKNTKNGYVGDYIRLSDFKGSDIQGPKVLEAINNKECGYRYRVNQNVFNDIPGKPIAFWASESILEAFKGENIYSYSVSDGQNKTANNDRYLRLNWEVQNTEIGPGLHYILYAKGGTFRKWYGNLEYVIDWSEGARSYYKRDNSARIIPEYLWYEPGITWTLLSSAETGFRLLPEEATFDMTGSSIFLKEQEDLPEILGLLNSKVSQFILKILSSTMAYQINEIRRIPYKRTAIKDNGRIPCLVSENIELTRNEWDSFETSFDFKKHPLI
jgi:hypothetical protein